MYLQIIESPIAAIALYHSVVYITLSYLKSMMFLFKRKTKIHCFSNLHTIRLLHKCIRLSTKVQNVPGRLIQLTRKSCLYVYYHHRLVFSTSVYLTLHYPHLYMLHNNVLYYSALHEASVFTLHDSYNAPRSSFCRAAWTVDTLPSANARTKQ